MAAHYLILIYVNLGGDRVGCIVWTGDSSGVSGNHAVKWVEVVLSNQGVEEIKELKGWASKGVNTNQGIQGVENVSEG